MNWYEQSNDRLRSAIEIGADMKTRREALQLTAAGLAKIVGCSQSQVFGWENGDYQPGRGWVSRVTAALECSHSDLLRHPDTSGAGTDHQRRPENIAQTFWDGLGGLIDIPLHRAAFQNSRSMIVRSMPQKIMTVCEAFLAQCEYLRSGREFSSLSVEMDVCVDLATYCYENSRETDAALAGQVLFDACDKRVHWNTFVVARGKLRAVTDFDLGQLALLVTDSRSDKARQRRLCGRRGDVYKILGGEDPQVNDFARRNLLLGIEMQRQRYRSCPGYHVIRSLCITSARANIGDGEFEAMVALAEEALQSGLFSAHEEAHVLEGIAEAFAVRYGTTQTRFRRQRYETSATSHWQMAEKHSMWADLAHQEHPEFGLRIMRLPLTLGQWGIMEPFTAYGTTPRSKMRELAEAIGKRAADDHNDRVAEDMSNRVRTLAA